MADETQNTPTFQSLMEFVGTIHDFTPPAQDLHDLPQGSKKSNLASTGCLWWAGDTFERPGLYMWTGRSNVLVRSKQDLAVLIQADVSDPSAPQEGEKVEELGVASRPSCVVCGEKQTDIDYTQVGEESGNRLHIGFPVCDEHGLSDLEPDQYVFNGILLEKI